MSPTAWSRPPAPGETTPGETTPGERTPGETTPGERTPGERTPGERTPGERTHGEAPPPPPAPRRRAAPPVTRQSRPAQGLTHSTPVIHTRKVTLPPPPFSSLVPPPATMVAARNGYAFIEGAGGAPSVFTTPANQQAHNVFDVSLPIEDELVPFADWLKSLPASQRPKTAAYPMAQDPFADPPGQLTQTALQQAGVRTVYSKIFPAEVPDYTPAADNVASSGAQVVVLGSTDVPTVGAFMKAFEQQHYSPKIFIAATCPDQGSAFTTAVGPGNASRMIVPNAWYPGSPNPQSQKMVSEYVAKYGGSTSGVNPDRAEAYSVGPVSAQPGSGPRGT